MSELCSVQILRTDGSSETHEVGRHILSGWISLMIGADMWDTVNLRDGRVMIVDDTGAVDGKQPNKLATSLYRSVCRPDAKHWDICGDVAITEDQNFA
mgnify:CR=1 FL=1